MEGLNKIIISMENSIDFINFSTDQQIWPLQRIIVSISLSRFGNWGFKNRRNDEGGGGTTTRGFTTGVGFVSETSLGGFTDGDQSG